MFTDIKCPSCGHKFALGEAEAEEYKKELREQMFAYKKQKDLELAIQKEEFEKQKGIIETAAIRKTSEELAVKIRELEDQARIKNQQLQDLQKKELDLLRERNELEHRTKNIEIEIEKRLLEDRKKIEQEAIQRESQLFELKMKEKETQLDSLKKTIEELKRKSEQGSMQLQGEAQELLLEEMLKEQFPFDVIEEVGKGVEGADCILIVRNSIGNECGKIIFESKRTKAWSNTWIEKLKNDMRIKQADLAILVSQVFPKGMDCFGEKDGVWISSFKEVLGLTAALRNAIIRIAETRKSEENKGEKMQMLYSYVSGLEFKQQIESIAEAFRALQDSTTKEKMQMEKNWKERQRLIEKAFINTVHVYGSIKGIAGGSVKDIPLLEGIDEQDDSAH